MEPKKLKIYDLDAFFHTACNKEAFRYQKVAIFEGTHGVVVAEEEAVHKKEKSLSSTIEIEANDPASPGHMWLMPSYIVTLPISEIKDAPFTEMTMEEFFRRRDYNPRCQSNWRILLSSLNAIGFDLNDYLPQKNGLDQTIKGARGRAEARSSGNHMPQDHER